MKRTLSRRLQRIETARGVRPDPNQLHIIVIHFVSPDQREMSHAKLHGGDRTWHRGPEESEEAFTARVEAEAREEGRLVTVFMSATDMRL